MGTQARDRLLRAAEELFYAEGIRAVGVERLLAASEVGRASFYRHFTSKDELVVTLLREHDEGWRRWLANAVAERGGAPLAVFDALAERFAAADFRGCFAINTMVEVADQDSVLHQVAADHKRAVTDYLDGLLNSAGQPDHRALAETFMQLIDGAMVTALRDRSPAPAVRARAIAAGLLAANPAQPPAGSART